MRVLILLCTFNGEKYLREQLDSLLAQDYMTWTCHAFDDGSTDATLQILNDYSRLYPDKFVVHKNVASTGSAAKNFSQATQYICSHIDFDLLAYCDQDDVWVKDKLLSLSSVFLSRSETSPLLVFSDLNVVDDGLAIVRESFVAHISVGGFDKHMKYGLLDVDNVIPGCALMCNRALLQQALPIPSQALMHDWWLVMAAVAKGSIVFLRRPLVKYRQHESNSVGAKTITFAERIRRAPSVAMKFFAIVKMQKAGYGRPRLPMLLAKYVYAKAYKFLCYR